MNRLTILIDNGLDEICFEVPSDKEGLYNIFDVANLPDDDEKAEILFRIAERLKTYEDILRLPEDVLILENELEAYKEGYLKYKDLEKQCLLIKLPCKVGDTVFIYADFTKNFEPYTVEAIHLGSCYTMQFDCNLYMLDELIDATEFELEDIGKTVFLTREEADKALEVK